MPYIKVKMNKLLDASQDLSNIEEKIGRIENSFMTSYRRIDWEVRDKADINLKVQNISRQLENQQDALVAMSNFLSTTYDRYVQVSRIEPEERRKKNHSSTSKGDFNGIHWVSEAMKEWLDRTKHMVEDWVNNLKNQEKKFIDDWATLLNVNSGNYAEKLVAMVDILNHPFESSALTLKWLIYRGSREGWFYELFDALDFQHDGDGIYHVNVNRYEMNEEQERLYDYILEGFNRTPLPYFAPNLMKLLADKDGICWQQFGGYTDLYDYIFDCFCDMKANKDISFVTKSGERYTLWMWKGEYLNLGAGGELGIYRGNGGVLACAVDQELKITLTVDYGDGTPPVEWEDNTWWVTSFNPKKQDYPADQLTLTYTIDFSTVDPEIWEAFRRTYIDSKEIKVDFPKDKPKTAVITF